MAYGIGTVLAIIVTLFARSVGLDRDRAFYPTVLIVIGLIYVLFAVIGGSVPVLMVETAVMAGFALLAVVGFKSNLWIVAAGLAGHGVFDVFHGSLVRNAGVPEWWPPFCMAYDICAGGCVAWLLKRKVFIK